MGLLKVLKRGMWAYQKIKVMNTPTAAALWAHSSSRTTKRHDRTGQMSPLLAGQETWVKSYERSGDCRVSSVLSGTRGMRQLEALAWALLAEHQGGTVKCPLTAGRQEDVMETWEQLMVRLEEITNLRKCQDRLQDMCTQSFSAQRRKEEKRNPLASCTLTV